MQIINKSGLKFGRKKRGRVVEIKTESGKTKKIRLHKNLPKGCKTPKRICIECLTNVIHKLDLNYDLKVCKECMGNKSQY